jgi:hypothetical protein
MAGLALFWKPKMDSKICADCGKRKLLSEYYKYKSDKPSVYRRCKSCTKVRHAAYQKANPDKRSKYHLDWRNKNIDKARTQSKSSRMKCKYGLTELDYLAMLLKQNHQCAICGTANMGAYGRFHIDHCHSTGIVRGLLCHHCNIMLGHAKDDPIRLRAAIRYLNGSST